MSDLADLIADLEHAGGPGIARVSTSVTKRADIEVGTGFHGPQLPGPALQSVLAEHGGHATRRSSGDPAALGRVADHMAADVADQAAGLLAGH